MLKEEGKEKINFTDRDANHNHYTNFIYDAASNSYSIQEMKPNRIWRKLSL
ncbi:MAG: hypothetical protein JETT_3411 [Candidatus Jettenia ecosi]|uniref:Uncharacterized protein n=1 Tax=Candidatus Jettenia ecosi TaxID=2494326 RepID=A0A533Q6W6_9BACT|nr:MAG: hypothetical protein JETT_3411 [Candidatus Jettenia ecosi]